MMNVNECIYELNRSRDASVFFVVSSHTCRWQNKLHLLAMNLYMQNCIQDSKCSDTFLLVNNVNFEVNELIYSQSFMVVCFLCLASSTLQDHFFQYCFFFQISSLKIQ